MYRALHFLTFQAIELFCKILKTGLKQVIISEHFKQL